MFTNVRIAGKNFLQKSHNAPSVTVSKDFRIGWLLLGIAKKGQEELSDITVLFFVVTLLSRDLSSAPRLSLNKEMLLFCILHASLFHVRWQVPTQRKMLFLFLSPFPEPHVQTETILQTDSWRADSRLGIDYTPKNQLRSCFPAGWPLAAHLTLAQMQALLLRAHISLRWTAGLWRSPNLVSRLEAGHREAPPAETGGWPAGLKQSFVFKTYFYLSNNLNCWWKFIISSNGWFVFKQLFKNLSAAVECILSRFYLVSITLVTLICMWFYAGP